MNKPYSQLAAIRDEAARVLERSGGGPLHVSKIAEGALATLGLSGKVTVKAVNNGLHRDPERRFERVGKGTWRIREPKPQP